MVTRNQGVLELVGQSQSTFGNSSDVETCGTMRWGAMVAYTAARAFATSLLNLRLGGRADGEVPGPHHPGGGERGPSSWVFESDG